MKKATKTPTGIFLAVRPILNVLNKEDKKDEKEECNKDRRHEEEVMFIADHRKVFKNIFHSNNVNIDEWTVCQVRMSSCY